MPFSSLEAWLQKNPLVFKALNSNISYLFWFWTNSFSILDNYLGICGICMLKYVSDFSKSWWLSICLWKYSCLVILPKRTFVVFFTGRKLKFRRSRNLSSNHRVKNESLGAPRCDLRGQNWGQIQNLHEKLLEISLSHVKRWPLKIWRYSLGGV